MLHNPEVVRAAQVQLDTVCGARLPTWEVRVKLRCIEALMKETIRWTWCASGHLERGLQGGCDGGNKSYELKTNQEFEYKGYAIPKGTLLIDNLWSVTKHYAINIIGFFTIQESNEG
ncbi:hypothetical protein DACRYDRAFT_56797 [Dacryopinax primogenitus]|uniref:Cytochrome P450 n=1 Tax=Dacryopinax primogenitus (strain DJM 731) TaxID=1858805 RepID=M5FQ16_DACPD|nr:uncharacterized protein DACRYDRAFT_56797 [Dacryopinax primogenitus]EJT98915.1 hypothetical protein DACRYDRAFT_56797 [Dacryopinax primogenitus]